MFLEGFKRVRNRFLIRLDMTFRPHGRPKKQHNGSCAGEKGSSLNSASLTPKPLGSPLGSGLPRGQT